MIVSVAGGSKSQKKHTKEMVYFCASVLMPRIKNLEINVTLCKPKGALGYCLELDNKKEFEIEIDKSLPLRRLLETVAHEMVHVKQYARRELHPDIDGCWMGKVINPKKVSYWDLPWEIEAHGRETGLFIRYCETNNLSKFKWTQE
jgi:hypothetical protein